MYCEKCGTKIEDGDVFCGECGWKIEPVENPVPPVNPVPNQVNNPGVAAPNMISGQVQNSQNFVDTFKSNPQVTVPIPGADKAVQNNKKKPKGKKLLIVTAILAVVAVCVFLFFDYIVNAAFRTFAPEEKYYGYVEKKNALQLSEAVLSTYSTYTSSVTNNENEIKATIKMELGEEGIDSLEQYTVGLEDLGMDNLSWLSSVSLDYTITTEEQKTQMCIAFLLGDVQIMTYDMLIDSEAEKMYVQIPELSSDYLVFNMEQDEVDAMLTMYESQDAFQDALPTEKELQELLKRYFVVMIDSITEVEKDSSEISAAGISQKYTELSYRIDTDLIVDIIDNIYKTAKKDKDLKKIINNFAEAAGMDYAPEDDFYDELMDSFGDSVEELKEGADSANVKLGKMTIWVDAKGDIVGREINFSTDMESMTIAYYAPKKGNKEGFDFIMKADRETLFEVEGTGLESGGRLTGDYSFIMMDYEIVTLSLDKFDTEAWKKGSLQGAVEIACGDELKQCLDATIFGYSYEDTQLFTEVLSDYSLRMEWDSQNKSEYRSSMAVLKNGENVVSYTLTGNVSKGGTVKKLSDGQCYSIDDESEAYLENCDFNSFIKNLKKADLPDEIIELIERLENEPVENWDYIIDDYYYDDYYYDGDYYDDDDYDDSYGMYE